MKGLWSHPVCTLKGQIGVLHIPAQKNVLLWATKYADIWVQVKTAIISLRRCSTIKSKLVEARFGQVPWQGARIQHIQAGLCSSTPVG